MHLRVGSYNGTLEKNTFIYLFYGTCPSFHKPLPYIQTFPFHHAQIISGQLASRVLLHVLH